MSLRVCRYMCVCIYYWPSSSTRTHHHRPLITPSRRLSLPSLLPNTYHQIRLPTRAPFHRLLNSRWTSPPLPRDVFPPEIPHNKTPHPHLNTSRISSHLRSQPLYTSAHLTMRTGILNQLIRSSPPELQLVEIH